MIGQNILCGRCSCLISLIHFAWRQKFLLLTIVIIIIITSTVVFNGSLGGVLITNGYQFIMLMMMLLPSTTTNFAAIFLLLLSFIMFLLLVMSCLPCSRCRLLIICCCSLGSCRAKRLELFRIRTAITAWVLVRLRRRSCCRHKIQVTHRGEHLLILSAALLVIILHLLLLFSFCCRVVSMMRCYHLTSNPLVDLTTNTYIFLIFVRVVIFATHLLLLLEVATWMILCR